MTILEALIQLRDDIKTWVANNLNQKVSISRKINGKELSADITLTAEDIGADTSGSASAIQSNLDIVSTELTEHTNNSDIHFTAAERTKLSGIDAEFATINAEIDSINTTLTQKSQVQIVTWEDGD